MDLFQSSAVAAAEERKTKEEQIHTAIAGKIRKRDEDADDAQVVVVPRKDLLELKEDRLKSRLLYGNPVCLLTTVVPRVVREQKGAAKTEEEEEDGTAEERSGAEGPARGDNEKITEGEAGMVQLAEGGSRRNVMVLSWLTPVNNEGAFVCAIHKRRFSVDCLRVRGHFSLSVPVQGMEALVLKCGDITGKNVDKFRLIDGLKPVKLGTFSEDLTLQHAAKKEMRGVGGSAAGSENPFALLDGDGEAEQVERGLLGDDETAVSGCVAHLECRVVSMTDAEDGKHHLISSQALVCYFLRLSISPIHRPSVCLFPCVVAVLSLC